jgi:hypothetical protein
MDIIDPQKFGVSFSVKQCRNFDINPDECLNWLIKQGFRRFRLMSYWDEIEKQPGTYDFSALDQQLEIITKAGGVVTLCLGARQPRWPENHWPQWAWDDTYERRTKALLSFVEKTVKRYRKNPCIISYQLENEALLKNFGQRAEVSRKRLRDEFRLVKRLDPSRPIIMTTSTAFGIPIIGPIPDIVGFSFYTKFFDAKSGKYHEGKQTAASLKLRARAISILWRKPSFIHELQLEPWGPKNIWEMSPKEQAKSMSKTRIAKNLRLAKKSGLCPLDLWGGEWWFAKLRNDPSFTKIINRIARNI